MTGFQIELGNVHTDFEHRLFGQELALCQRYFIKISDGKYRRVGGYKRNDTNVYFQMQTPVPMRTAPSPTLSDGGLFTNFAQTYTASQNNPSIQEWNTDTGQGLLGIQSSYSNQSEFIPSWESYELELSAEL